MKILTWNVFWKAMRDKTPRCVNGSCVRKINEIIPGFDLVCLQEASGWKKLTNLRSYGIQVYKPASNVLVTAYDTSKYYLDYSIAGTMKDADRIFMISFFNHSFAVINVHAGHNYDVFKLETYISRVADPETIARLQIYDIILLGDFNDPVTKLKLFGRHITGPKTKPTCCYSHNGNTFIGKYLFDHILSTVPVKTAVLDMPDASDHKPVIGVLYRTIINGYDFDGVIQSSVTQPDANGERHPKRPLKISPMIRQLILEQLSQGQRIVVITARSKMHEPEIRQLIGQHFPIFFTNGSNKASALFAFGVNRYYEDSPLRIKEILTSKHRLPLLKQLFYVDPDNQRMTQVI